MISTSDIISGSFSLYKENFLDYLKYIALNFLPGLVAFAIFSIFGITAALGISSGSGIASVASLSFSVILSVTSFVFIAGLAIWINFAFMRMIGVKAKGGDTEGVLSNFLEVRSRFWRAIGTSFLVGLYAGWPMIVVMVLYSLTTLGGIGNSATSILFGLLSLAAMIYAFYYSIRLVFSVFHVIINDGEIMGSINFSKNKVDGHWWGVFWRLIAPAIVFFLIVFVAQLILAGVTAAIDAAVVSGFIALLLFLIQVLAPPLYPTAQVILYMDVASDASGSETQQEVDSESQQESTKDKTEETQPQADLEQEPEQPESSGESKDDQDMSSEEN